MVPFECVSLVVPRAALEAVEAALAAAPTQGFSPLAEVLGAAFRAHEAQRATVTTHLDAARRAELVEALADLPELRARLLAAPDEVRAAMLVDVGRYAARRTALSRLSAPAVVLDGTTAALAEAVRALDPAAPFASAPAPAVPEIDLEDGRVRPNLHAWLELVLEHAREQGSIAVEGRIAEAPAEGAPDPSMRPDIESTCFGMRPVRAWWLPRAITLPRQIDHGRTVVGFAGGPVTWATGDDPAPSGVEGTLAQRLAALGPDQALVSFLAMDTGVDVPWADR